MGVVKKVKSSGTQTKTDKTALRPNKPEEEGQDSAELPKKHNNICLADKWLSKSIEFRDRLLYLIERWAPDRSKYDYLESRTGIAATRWKNLCNERQFPTIEMVLAVCEHDPRLAHWLLTGSDPANPGPKDIRDIVNTPIGPPHRGDDKGILFTWEDYQELSEMNRKRRKLKERKVAEQKPT
jgi:hypothetical protein